jgi:hypothetical protein
MVQKPAVRSEWNRRRTRHDPPGLEEAVAAAQGLTADVESQVEIAAQLMGLREDEVRPLVLKASAPSRCPPAEPMPIPSKGGRTILVERRGRRIPVARAG